MEERRLVKRKQWDSGILPSFLLFLAEIFLLITFIVISFYAHGDAGVWIGAAAFVLFILAVIGIVVSVKAIRKRSEPAGMIRLLCGMHILMLLNLIGIYVLGILELV